MKIKKKREIIKAEPAKQGKKKKAPKSRESRGETVRFNHATCQNPRSWQSGNRKGQRHVYGQTENERDAWEIPYKSRIQ